MYVTALTRLSLHMSLAYRGLPLVEHEYCAVLLYPGEGRQGPADGLLPGLSGVPYDLVLQRLHSNSERLTSLASGHVPPLKS